MKKGIIVTSFGTSHNETRELCIDVKTQMIGLGQVKAFQDIFIEHLDRVSGE